MSCCIKSQTIKNLHCMYARGVGPQLKEQGCSLYLLEVEKTVFISLKVPLKSNNFSISIFLHFRTQKVFPKDLAKFQAIMNIRTHVYWTFIS